MSHVSPNASTPRTPASRIAALVAGSLVGLIAFAFLVGGGVLLWGDNHKDRDGYLTSATHRFATGTYALSSGNMDVNLHAPRWLVDHDRLGSVRLKATSRDGKPLFVGIAPAADVSAYLSGSPHASIADLGYWPFHASYRRHEGAGRPLLPAQQRFWAASAHGSGPETLTWKVRRGNWSIVVMNADGSRGVDARVSAGATLPAIGTAGWISLGTGSVLIAAAAGLVAVGARAGRRPAPRTGASPTPVAA
jgi:hypothetical protein